MSIRDHILADRRLAILRLLIEAGGECGESSLEKGLRALGFGAMLDRDAVQAELKYLKEHHCLEIDLYDGRVMVAAITKLGVSAANGSRSVPGVSAPAMGR